MKTIGIVGGLGPLAGISFAQHLVEIGQEMGFAADQQHAPWILMNRPGDVPDRTDSLLLGGVDFVPPILDQLAALRRSGADVGVIACNTAHVAWEMIRQAAPMPMMSIVHETVRYVCDRYPSGNIGLLATDGSLKLRLYADPLEAAGYEVLTPRSRSVHDAILAIKAGRLMHARRILSRCAGELEDRDCSAIVLGCTEIPLALKSFPTPLINPTRILAEAAMRFSLE